jgi:hypothetical protein
MIINLKQETIKRENIQLYKKLIYCSAIRLDNHDGSYYWVWGYVIKGVDGEPNKDGYIKNGTREKTLLEACTQAINSITDYRIPIIVICSDSYIKNYLDNCKYWKNNCGWNKCKCGTDEEIKKYMHSLAEITRDRDIKYICPNNSKNDKYLLLAERIAKKRSDMLKNDYSMVS